MAPDKPSKNEAEYFALREAERLKARKAAAAARAAEAERQSHFMKCPKCGADLVTEEYLAIQIERCTECNGLWFDAGEAEELVEQNQRKGIGGTFRAIVQSVRGPARSSSDR